MLLEASTPFQIVLEKVVGRTLIGPVWVRTGTHHCAQKVTVPVSQEPTLGQCHLNLTT